MLIHQNRGVLQKTTEGGVCRQPE